MTISTRETLRAGTALALCAAVAVFTSASAPVTAAEPGHLLRTIAVSGMGEVNGTPDQAHISAGVVTEGRTAAEALAANARAMNEVFATLKRLGIPEKNIQTSNFNIQPRYDDNNSDNVRHIVGYQVTNTVNVTVDGVAKTGPAMDALVAAGANQSYGISFTIADPKPLEQKARAEAVTDAMGKARTIAAAAHMQLGRIISINEGGGYMPMPMQETVVVTGYRNAAPTPVAAGEASAVVSLAVIYEVE